MVYLGRVGGRGNNTRSTFRIKVHPPAEAVVSKFLVPNPECRSLKREMRLMGTVNGRKEEQQ